MPLPFTAHRCALTCQHLGLQGRLKPDLPRPRPWCHHGIDGLNVAEIFAMDLEEVLGRPGALLCKTGFEEAVERTAANNNFR